MFLTQVMSEGGWPWEKLLEEHESPAFVDVIGTSKTRLAIECFLRGLISMAS